MAMSRNFGNVLSSFSSLCIRQNISFGRSTPLPPAFLVRCLPLSTASNKDVPKLKKAKGPYLQFCVDKRTEIKEANPGFQMKDVASALGQMWRGLSEDEKQTYKQRYEVEKEEVKKTNEAVLESLTPEQKEQMEEERKKKKHAKEKRQHRALCRDLNRPKPHGLNPFFLFRKDLDRGNADVKDFTQGASEKWKRMAVEDKEKYVAEAKANGAKFKLELEEWEKKMFKTYNHHVLSETKLQKFHKAQAAAKAAESKASSENASASEKPKSTKKDE